MPVDTSPILLLTKGNQPLDQNAPRPVATGFRSHEHVLKITNRLETPCMGMENIVHKPDWIVAGATGKKTSDRYVRRENASPDALVTSSGTTASKTSQ